MKKLDILLGILVAGAMVAIYFMPEICNYIVIAFNLK
jgi:hypothetical protein